MEGTKHSGQKTADAKALRQKWDGYDQETTRKPVGLEWSNLVKVVGDKIKEVIEGQWFLLWSRWEASRGF